MIFASVLLLCGCAEGDWSYVTGDGDTPRVAAAPSASAAANYASFTAAPTDAGKCARVAQDRRDDSDAQGFDEDVQQQVYDRTYASCMEWAAHFEAR